MSSAITIYAGCFSQRNEPPRVAAALEILIAFSLIAAGSALFVAGGMNTVQAAHLTLLLLISLVGLAWKRFDQGRHPAFLFLCVLTLFQGGRLFAFGPDAETEMFRVTLMTSTQFDIPRDVTGRVLLSIALSAVAIYSACRFTHRCSAPLSCERYRHFLPYAYRLFILSIPVQLYKNYCYYTYARDHGGYLVFFIDHGGLAASIPVAVRAISLISLPAFAAILVLEDRKKLSRLAVAVYFAVMAPVLVTGSRGALFSLVLSLWYLHQSKSQKPLRPYTLLLIASALIVVGALVGSVRVENGSSPPLAGPAQFIADQGMSLHVTEVAVLYRARFLPHIGSYLASELQSAFVASDQANYVLGRRFSDDVAMFLNPITYQLGFGSGSSYIAEAYILGGLTSVVLISATLGVVLHAMYLLSKYPLGLFLVVMVLPDLLWMSRGGLLDWLSAALRVTLSTLLLAAGWFFDRLLRSLWAMPRVNYVALHPANWHPTTPGGRNV